MFITEDAEPEVVALMVPQTVRPVWQTVITVLPVPLPVNVSVEPFRLGVAAAVLVLPEIT